MFNPLGQLLDTVLPEMDVGVMWHGFADHGRDYEFTLENSFSTPPGTFRLVLTHVVACQYHTRVRDDVWPRSWSDEFTDYAAWEAAGEPDGYVFGTNWSLAYPGFLAPDDDPQAAEWSERLSRPMHAASIETDRFAMTLIFHDARLTRIGNGAPVTSQVIVPL